MVVKLLPNHLHVSSIGFATALGGTGGAMFPFAVGAIAQAKGVEVSAACDIGFAAGCHGVVACLPKKVQENGLKHRRQTEDVAVVIQVAQLEANH